MRRRRILLLLAGCAIIALLALCWPAPEPSCQNKSLSEWLDIYSPNRPSHRGDAPQTALASNAVHSIGTNAIPFLLTWLKYERPAWRKATISLMDALPTQLGDRGVTYWLRSDESARHERALDGFYILGPSATSAIPALAQQLTDSRSPPKPSITPIFAAQCLSYLGKDAIPSLLAGLTNSDPTVRAASTGALSVLAHHGIDITPAIPPLLERLQDTNLPTSQRAAWALGSLKASSETVVPHLTDALKDPRPLVRRNSANALAQFETNAASAAPALIQTLSDPDRAVRRAATNALLKISPQSLSIPAPQN